MTLGITHRGARDSLPVHRMPAAEKFRIMQWIRAVAAVLVLLSLWLSPNSFTPHPWALLPLTLGFTAAGLAAWVVSVVLPAHTHTLLRVMLVVDALWLTWGAYWTGGAASPMHFVILLHLAAITLLASWRTGLALAALDTALMLGTATAVGLGGLTQTAPSDRGAPTDQLGLFIGVLCIVALSTATLSVLNERELRRRRHDVDALSALTNRVERSANVSTVAQTLLETVVTSYGLRRGVVLASQDGSLPLLAKSGLADDFDPGLPGRSAVIQQAYEQGRTLLVQRLDPETDGWLLRLLGGASSLLVVPLSMDNRCIGAIVVEASGRLQVQRRLVPGLQRSATYGALALRNAWLLEGVQRLAATDGLTKIANRRSFEVTLEREIARATRTAEYVSLVLVDIDHFKKLNDTFGHQAGDEVLRNVAAALACECREFDTAARYGGEEFAVVLPGCAAEQAREIAERLREAIATSPNVAPVTASAGVATFPAHAGDAESLVRAADQALYVSKRTGRDRTTMSEGVPPEEQMAALIRRAVRERLRAKGQDGTLPALWDS